MKLKFARKELLSALETVSACICKSTLPIIEQLKMEYELLGDVEKVVISATNLEQSIHVRVNAECEDVGEKFICISGKKLLSVVKNFTGKDVVIETKDNTIVVKCEKAKINFKTVNKNDYPEIETMHIFTENDVCIPTSEFLDMAKKVKVSVAPSCDTRTSLKGILFESIDSTVSLVATDGKKLTVASYKETVPVPENEFIIPIQVFNLINYLHGEKTNIAFSENKVYLESGNVTIISKLVDGKFPNYKIIIPASTKFSASVKTADFMQKLRMIKGFMSNMNVSLQIVINKQDMQLSTNDMDGAVEDVIECESNVEQEMKFTFNIDYLINQIATCNAESFQLYFENDISAFKIMIDNNTTFIIMPMRNK